MDVRANPEAFALLGRDLENVCKHFTRYGLRPDAPRLLRDLRARYLYGGR